MSPWKFHQLLRDIKDLPDHFLTRLINAATEERLKRDQLKLKIKYNNQRNH